ncbi:MAG TPA: hypothetical protein VL981_06750, partial [Candidatus Methylacidiphilales bacterium]|nr:hypothetical protein [Candidatus Methylacidiphilales bacterium]
GREEEWLDNKNEKLFWGLKIQQDETGGFLSDDHPEPYPAAIIVDQLANGLISNPQNVEVGFDIPNRDAKIAAYLHDPDLVTVRVDQTHPYRRVIDIGKLYNFSQPGHYRLQIFHSDDWLIGAAHLRSGNYMASGVIDVSVVP